MDVNQMRMVLALAESRSMTATAKKLHVTQPALTYQLNVIEDDLGFKVFERSRAGTRLTAPGANLCETLIDVIRLYDDAVATSRGLGPEAPVLQEEEDEELDPLHGSALIATLQGDPHTLGKTLVATLLRNHGIDVESLDEATPAQIAGYVNENGACRLVLLSVFHDEQLDCARKVMGALRGRGLRDRVYVMVGGSATSRAFAQEIGADAFTSSAVEAADAAEMILRYCVPKSA